MMRTQELQSFLDGIGGIGSDEKRILLDGARPPVFLPLRYLQGIVETDGSG